MNNENVNNETNENINNELNEKNERESLSIHSNSKTNSECSFDSTENCDEIFEDSIDPSENDPY